MMTWLYGLEQVKWHESYMLTVVSAAAIAGAAQLVIKWTSRVGVVVRKYSIIELRIYKALLHTNYNYYPKSDTLK